MVYIGVDYNSMTEFIESDLQSFLMRNPGYKAERIERDIVNVEDNMVELHHIYSPDFPVEQYITYYHEGSKLME